MFAELGQMTEKIDEKKDNSDWLIGKVESLKSTAEFVNRYHTSVLNIAPEIIAAQNPVLLETIKLW